MKQSLEIAIKADIEYTDQHLCCEKCLHFKQEPDSHIDRMWNDECHLFIETLGTMSVKSHGKCKHFTFKKGEGVIPLGGKVQ